MNITISGRRWFNKRTGNTYHTADIMINGIPVHKLDYAYGYGDQYLPNHVHNAADWLEANGYLPGREPSKNGGPKEIIWRYCERLNIKLNYSCHDVSRKKDL